MYVLEIGNVLGKWQVRIWSDQATLSTARSAYQFCVYNPKRLIPSFVFVTPQQRFHVFRQPSTLRKVNVVISFFSGRDHHLRHDLSLVKSTSSMTTSGSAAFLFFYHDHLFVSRVLYFSLIKQHDFYCKTHQRKYLSCVGLHRTVAYPPIRNTLPRVP